MQHETRESRRVIQEYARSKKPLTIATISRHSCVQILHGAKAEGFKTLAIAVSDDEEEYYRGFSFAIDEVLRITSWGEFYDLSVPLIERRALLIPHGSFVAYLDLEKVKEMPVPYFGNRAVLDWEADRRRQREWLMRAGVSVPQEFTRSEEIDRPVIVKFFGAEGGKGYFVARSAQDFERQIGAYEAAHGRRPYIIQEYIIGNPMYFHVFATRFPGRYVPGIAEYVGEDLRYESNADSLGRIPLRWQEHIDITPTFEVIGNIDLVARESLEPKIEKLGRQFVEASQALIDARGLWGPFCFEMVYRDGNFYAIEFSARIVAGTNVKNPYSPRMLARYGKWMTMGRRIADEIRYAKQHGKLEEVLD